MDICTYLYMYVCVYVYLFNCVYYNDWLSSETMCYFELFLVFLYCSPFQPKRLMEIDKYIYIYIHLDKLMKI